MIRNDIFRPAEKELEHSLRLRIDNGLPFLPANVAVHVENRVVSLVLMQGLQAV